MDKPAMGVSDVIQMLCLAYLVAWAISPPLAIGDVYRALALVSAALWAAIELLRPDNIFFKPSGTVLLVFVYLFYTVCIEMIVPDQANIARQYQSWIMLMFLLIHESYRRRGIWRMRPLFWIALLLFPIWLYTTLRGYTTFGSNASRLVTRASAQSQELQDAGIGGFGLIYSVMVSIPILAYFVIAPSRVNWDAIAGSAAKRGAAWLLIFLNLALSIIVVFNAGYMIAVLITLVSLGLVSTIRSRSPWSIAVLVVASLSVFTIAAYALEPLADFAVAETQGTLLAPKARDFRASLEESKSVGTVKGRSERYTRSMQLFIENPVIGTLSIDDVGKHSAILDRFAEYGIIFGSIFAYLLFSLPLRVLRHSARNFGVALSVVFVVILFSMLNNVFASFGFMVFVFYPAAMSYLHRGDRRDDPSQRPSPSARAKAMS